MVTPAILVMSLSNLTGLSVHVELEDVWRQKLLAQRLLAVPVQRQQRLTSKNELAPGRW